MTFDLRKKKQKQKWREWKSRRADLWVGDARWRERHLTDNRCVMLFGQYDEPRVQLARTTVTKGGEKKFRGNEQCHQRRYRELMIYIRGYDKVSNAIQRFL